MTYLFFVNWKRKKARKEGRMSAILWRDLHLPQPNYLCPKLLFLWSFACKTYERKTSFCLHPSCSMLSINGKGIVGWHILGNINTVVWTTTLRKKSWLGCRSIQSNVHFTTLYTVAKGVIFIQKRQVPKVWRQLMAVTIWIPLESHLFCHIWEIESAYYIRHFQILLSWVYHINALEAPFIYFILDIFNLITSLEKSLFSVYI